MDGCRIITPRDVIVLVDKVYSRFKPLTSSSPFSASASHVNESSGSQTSPTDDEDDVEDLFAESQEPNQSQVWPAEDHDDDDDDVGQSLEVTAELLPSPPKPTIKISTLELYITPAFKQAKKYLKLSQILRVLESIQVALIKGVILQVRRVYYEDKELFKTQDCVCNIIRCLEDYWEVPSSRFNVLAAYKGFFAGPIGFITRREYLLEDRYYNEDITSTSLTPSWGCTWSNDYNEFVYKQEHIVDSFQLQSLITKSEISWVLVVEKETVFSERVQELNRDRNKSQTGSGIIVTGKGMPDIATRRMLEMMANTLPDSVPFYALMDGDAYGMHIYHTFCSSIRHYSGQQQMANRLEWIGLKPSDLLPLLYKFANSTIDGSLGGSGAIQIDLNEHTRAQLLANNDQAKDDVKMEALRLILYGYKMELEAVSNQPLNSLLPQVSANSHSTGFSSSSSP